MAAGARRTTTAAKMETNIGGDGSGDGNRNGSGNNGDNSNNDVRTAAVSAR